MLSWKKSQFFLVSVSAWSNLYLKHLLKTGRRYSAKAQVLSLVQSLGAQEVLMQLKWAWQEDGFRWKFLPCSGLPNDITALPSVLTQAHSSNIWSAPAPIILTSREQPPDEVTNPKLFLHGQFIPNSIDIFYYHSACQAQNCFVSSQWSLDSL